MRTPKYHNSEEAFEVCGVHDDDHFIWCQFLLLNYDPPQLTLYPLRTASMFLGNLLMRLFAMSELFPNLSTTNVLFLTALFVAPFALPNLSIVVGAIFLE